MRFDLRRIAPQPWKNGAGLTREIAVAHNAGSEFGFDWRLSVAEVTHDAPFSAFRGVDRCIVLLRGAGLRLRTPDTDIETAATPEQDRTFEHRLDTPFAPFHFPGDVPLHATLLGGPCSDLNVMVRRGAWRAELACHHAAVDVPAVPVLMLLACAGSWRIDASPGSPALTLHADQGLLWRDGREWAGSGAPAPHLNARPLRADGEARLLQVRLCHDPGS